MFETFLARLFRSPRHLKVGFGFDSDLKGAHWRSLSLASVLCLPISVESFSLEWEALLTERSLALSYTHAHIVCAVLHQTFPDRDVFLSVTPFLEVRSVVPLH